ncbi:3-hydroxyacyl-CoA dehydrogenase NAD-binding domain-containing protein [Ruegeria sp. SCPT10]|uniref:3-hydroxyacyl-CoA dehydrogenase NAD-binding domain-containing protein n=1 Tax=Ruegeria sp. SCP10 TaxID=3141377 RepID=UPI00333B0486
MTVSVSSQGAIAVVTIDNPPVNAINQAVRQGLLDALRQTGEDASVQAVILICTGRTFVAGADVREFGKPPLEPHLPDVLRAIEATGKPWIAALHGSVLGGGLELAMACRYRIAAEGTKMGLPEVNLGLIPGAGGTVQLPRLIPADMALEMIAGGKPITADKALAAGLIDARTSGDLLQAAVELAQKLETGKLDLPPLQRPVKAPSDMTAFEAKAQAIINRARGQNSPVVAVQAVKNALTLAPDDALVEERKSFLALKDDPQSAALRYIFFAERGTIRPDRVKARARGKIETVGVVGGGTMGAGIAAACILSGLNVVLVERDQAAANAGATRVTDTLAGSLSRGLISQAQFEKMSQNLAATTDYNDFRDADLVIEAVFEDMTVKKQVFAQLDTATRPDAILASNTSYLDVNEIAQSVRDPGRVIGLHFFSPAHIMKLLEIVVPDAVADEVLARAVGFGKKMGKTCVLAGVCDGFIANRIMSAYRRECEYMLEDGALPWQIDCVMVGFGLPMGIFQMQDLAGLDIAWAMRKRQAATRDPAQRYVEIADRMCEQGWFGQKAGRGWYIYDGKTRAPNPDVEALILSESKRKGISRRVMSSDEITERILRRMQSEAQSILDEGIAQNAQDVDVVMVNAFGFPRWKGGPMYLAETSDCGQK